MDMLTLEEMAEKTGASVRSLRYYIGKGWLPQPETRSEGPGRPLMVLPSTLAAKVRLIRRILHPEPSETLLAPTLGVYIYQDEGKRVQMEIVSREEHGPYVLLGLRNGDYILRKKAAEGEHDSD